MKLCFETIVEAPRQLVFAFFADPNNLQRIHDGDPSFRILHHEGNIEPGSETWFEINVAGILPVALGFRHIIHEPASRFAEQIIHGPFTRFDHIHEFSDAGSGTLVRDLLDIELPWFYGGEFSMNAAVGNAVRESFQARAKTVERLLQDGAFELNAGQRVK